MTQRDSKWVNLVWAVIILGMASLFGYAFYVDAKENPDRWDSRGHRSRQVEEREDDFLDPTNPLSPLSPLNPSSPISIF